MMFYHFKILNDEVNEAYINNREFQLNNKVMRAYTPTQKLTIDEFESFIECIYNETTLKVLFENDKKELQKVADIYENNRIELVKYFEYTKMSDKQIEKFYKQKEKKQLIKNLNQQDYKIIEEKDFIKFPSYRIMEYSLFQRQAFAKKKILINDVMDIKIASFSPYVDAVITEGFQANVYKKAKHIPELGKLEIHTLNSLKR